MIRLFPTTDIVNGLGFRLCGEKLGSGLSLCRTCIGVLRGRGHTPQMVREESANGEVVESLSAEEVFKSTVLLIREMSRQIK